MPKLAAFPKNCLDDLCVNGRIRRIDLAATGEVHLAALPAQLAVIPGEPANPPAPADSL